MNLSKRINAFAELGNKISFLVGNFEKEENFLSVLNKARLGNSWFTLPNQLKGFSAIAEMLNENELQKWISDYPQLKTQSNKQQTVALICAGNIPAVAFHDLLCILISGNKALLKLSSDDLVLLPWLSNLLFEIEPGLKDQIEFADRIKNADAIIATGSNNSARYFEYYFGKYPHIIRKNRNGVAVLTGNETDEDFKKLGVDIFQYFGLGCRNVSKLHVPSGFNFDSFFNSLESFGSEMMEHNKYMNNFDYHNALFLLERIPFLTNNFLILKEDSQIATPVSVLNYEYYSAKKELKEKLSDSDENIQCIVSKGSITGKEIEFGNTQHPALADYADGVDTMGFLINL